MITVFVDGSEGTTGLRIHEQLNKRSDIRLLTIDRDKRKDAQAKRECINQSDVVFLCLPDVAAKESVQLVENQKTKIIDASTAHRVDPEWVYGLAELETKQRENIQKAQFVSNPGCHSTGFLLLMYPMIKNQVISKEYPATCTSLTGYSGGGKKLIQQYEGDDFLQKNGPMHYGLTYQHKHLPEMKKYAQLQYDPVFMPIVSNFYNGMVVSIPFHNHRFQKKMHAKDVHEMMLQYYEKEPFIKVMPFEDQIQMLDPQQCNQTNRVDLFVFGHQEQTVLMARFDNLGKGASGAAIQNMNIMMGCDEDKGLKR